MRTEIKILIVDDEPDICYFLSRNLTRRGFYTSISPTIAEADKQLDIDKPAIVLLDNHLPDGKGIELACKITSKYPATKIIMITAHDSPQDRIKAHDCGVNFFLSKPFTIAEINQVIDLVVEPTM